MHPFNPDIAYINRRAISDCNWVERNMDLIRSSMAEGDRNRQLITENETLQAEIQRLREEQTRADWRAADLQRLNTEKAQEIERLRAEIESLRDQIVKHNLSIKEAIRRGKAFEWKTLTLDS